ncbi:MAG: hypothetical protein FWF46_03755 [Oscillospiraceae bacterium]|nr:hypothetical protein [Oscillospiraceae bacterium]
MNRYPWQNYAMIVCTFVLFLYFIRSHGFSSIYEILFSALMMIAFSYLLIVEAKKMEKDIAYKRKTVSIEEGVALIEQILEEAKTKLDEDPNRVETVENLLWWFGNYLEEFVEKRDKKPS